MPAYNTPSYHITKQHQSPHHYPIQNRHNQNIQTTSTHCKGMLLSISIYGTPQNSIPHVLRSCLLPLSTREVPHEQVLCTYRNPGVISIKISSWVPASTLVVSHLKAFGTPTERDSLGLGFNSSLLRPAWCP